MGSEKKRLTLDLDPQFQRRLKARAALQGISMREYCLAAIEKQLAKDESQASGYPEPKHPKAEDRHDT